MEYFLEPTNDKSWCNNQEFRAKSKSNIVHFVPIYCKTFVFPFLLNYYPLLRWAQSTSTSPS